MKRMILLLLVLALMLSLSACGRPQTTADPTDPTEDIAQTEEVIAPAGEYRLDDASLQSDFVCADNYRVFYEIFVGSFSDSDGDGVGDLRGIINRMDYLNDGDPNSGESLGVEGLWLTPIFQSPSYHKYDVADYYAVDASFGTMEDLEELVALCHARNVKVILDLPINHTSKQNAWYSAFVQAQRSGDTQSEAYDFYSWCPSGQTPAGRSFSQVSGTDVLYECNFSGDMPELNFDSQAVRQAVLDVAKFYLERGVDGFRFDAAKYIYYRDNSASVDFWNWYLGELRAIKPDLYTVAEVWDGDGITDLYYPAMNCFDFTTAQAGGLFAETANHGDVDRLTGYTDAYLDTVTGLREDAMMVPFLSNHDMDRAAGYLTEASGSMQVAANLYLLAPGSPFLYYGEEIGMRGSRGAANTDANRRLAMLWGDGDPVADPTGTTYTAAQQTDSTVTDQLAREKSLYTYYKKLLMIRHANPEIARGEYTPLLFSDSKVGGFSSTWQGETVFVIHNTTLREITVDLSEATELAAQITAVIGMNDVRLEGTELTLGAQTSVVLRAD